MRKHDEDVALALHELLLKVDVLEDTIEAVASPAGAVAILDQVMLAVHNLNEAYVEYANLAGGLDSGKVEVLDS